MSIEIIKKELFVPEVTLVKTSDINLLGLETSLRQMYYLENDLGYFIYRPKNEAVKLMDPINPTSFRWSMFNRQIIFVPYNNLDIPYKTLFKIHKNFNDYIVRFNLESRKYKTTVFVESNNIKQDCFFLIRKPKDYLIDFDNENVERNLELERLTELRIKQDLSTNRTNVLDVMPEFLHSRQIYKLITKENLDDVWKHWLASEYGFRLLDKNDQYFKKFSDTEWIDNVVAHLIFDNLLETPSKHDVDSDLKRLLGI